MSASSRRLPAETRLGRVALLVTDAGAVTEFYRDVVGLDVVARDGNRTELGVDSTTLLVLVEDGDSRHNPAGSDHDTAGSAHDTAGSDHDTPGSDHDTPGSAHDTAKVPAETGLYHSAFRLPSRAALGDALDRIRRRWQLDGASDHRVSEALYLTDPEGNGVELYCDRPREEWPVGPDGQVQMENAPVDLDALAADAAGNPDAPPGTDIGHVHLSVSSLDAVRSFYVETLGLDVRATVPGAVFLAAGDYHHHLGANTWHSRRIPGRSQDTPGQTARSLSTRRRGLAWFELLVPSAAALRAVRERLAAEGVSVTETDGGFAVTDPDDIELRLRVAD